jgi:Tol biopolymer transport system component
VSLATADTAPSEVTAQEVEAQLQRVCASPQFAASERLKSFLRFVVSESLAGRARSLKEYTVAVAVYERGTDFDPKVDSIVRSEARRLRAHLDAYYAGPGSQDPIQIAMPRGGYAPTVRRQPTAVQADVTTHAPAPVLPATATPPGSRRRRLASWGVPLVVMAMSAIGVAVVRSGPARSEPVMRAWPLQKPVPSGSVSHDGRYLAFHDASGTPWRMDLQNNQTTKLTFGPGDWDGQRAPAIQLSPDGRYVAYSWLTGADRSELRLMAVPGGEPRILRSAAARQTSRPAAWSADGRRLLVVTILDGSRVALDMLDIQSGESTPLIDLGETEPFGVTMTADARLVAYDHSPGSGPRDIFLLDTTTRRTTRVVARPGNDTLPVFVEDGRALLFASDRPGPLSLWRLPITRGRAGAPILERADTDRLWPLGVTPAGSFVHAAQSEVIDVQVAMLDSAGTVTAQPVAVGREFVGANLSPDWSPDGRFLAYVSQHAVLTVGPSSQHLVIRDRVTGRQRRLHPALTYVAQPRWSHDGRQLLVKGRGVKSGAWSLHVLDAGTGVVVQTVPGTGVADEWRIGSYQWVPTRNAILFARSGRGLVELDPATGAERVIVPLQPQQHITGGRGCAYAPDGQTLAYSVQQTDGRTRRATLHVREASGRTRELMRAETPDWLMLQGWAPDGESVYVVRQFQARPGAGGERREVWRVPIDGRPPVSTGLRTQLLRDVAVNRDGRTIAYVDGVPSWQIAVLER